MMSSNTGDKLLHGGMVVNKERWSWVQLAVLSMLVWVVFQ